MRVLNINEIEEKIDSESSDIAYIDERHSEDRITQFFNFLHSQPISKRILERICEDYSLINEKLPKGGTKVHVDHRTIASVKELLKTRDEQGAFGYFVIQNLFEIERKFDHHYTDAANVWYDRTGRLYSEMFEHFKEKFFNPFIDLLNWYIKESDARNEKDYFSTNEIIVINEKLDKILATQEAASEVIYDEIGELKELILFLNKKNWKEIFKGKLNDTALGLLVNNENLVSLFRYVSENMTLLK